MSDTGDRLVSAAYLREKTEPWRPGSHGLPNQGQLDTSVPAHAVDLDAIRRAGIPRHIDDWLEDRYAHPRPRVVRHRRRRAVNWWGVASTVAGIAVILLAIVGTAVVLRSIAP